MALLDYLSERRAQIEAEIKALRSELAEIRVAEAALTGANPYVRASDAGGNAAGSVRPGSIKDWTMKALAAFPGGLETDGVIEAVRKMGGPIVERSSMTPQLSRLKAAKLIEYNGRSWRLPVSQPEKDETPDGYQPAGASVVDDPSGEIDL